MAARNRGPRGLVKDDLTDEAQLWHSIVDKIRRCGEIHKQYEDTNSTIPSDVVKIPENEDLPQLETHSSTNRTLLRLSEEELKVLLEEPDALMSALETLISVRSAFEAEAPIMSLSSSRSGNVERGPVVAFSSLVSGGGGGGGGGGGPMAKARNLKRRLEIDGPGQGSASTVESPALTPEPVSATSVAGRLFGKSGNRSGSVGVGVGASKSEVASDATDGSKATMHDKYVHLKVGAQVFMRNKAKNADGEGILGNVTSIAGDGKARRYEIQDPEPDETGAQPPPYRAYLSSLEPIPPRSLAPTLPELPKGKQVIAVYPDTSTFYKAEVVGKRGELVRLRFEGEEERDKEQEVERRLVLDVK